jgi:tripartite-type tricarboxylate transporter receptor subunit TctC
LRNRLRIVQSNRPSAQETDVPNPMTRLVRMAAMIVLGALPLAAAAQPAFPARPVTIVMPYAAGGATDVAVRAVARAMAENLGKPVVIDNRPGAGAMLGAQFVARAAPDGYTLLTAVVANMVTGPLTSANVAYDAATAFDPVSLIAANPLVLVASKGSGIRDFADFLRRAKAEPGKLAVASYGVGTPSHLAIELMKAQAGIDVIHVPYNGSAPAMVDLRGGQVPALMDILPSHVKNLESGDVTGLALGQSARSSLAPGVPTFREAGLPEFEATTWFGLVAPAGTPAAVVDRLNASVRAALADPQVRQSLAAIGMEGQATSPQAFRSMIRADHERWAPVIRLANIPVK